MTAGIYAITCVPTGEQYIGRSNTLEARWIGHRRLLRKGKHHSRRLQAAWNMHAEAAFRFDVVEVLAYPLLNRDAWDEYRMACLDYRRLEWERERYWIGQLMPAFNIDGKGPGCRQSA